MNFINQVFIVIGIIVTLIGIGALLNPSIARIINFPGGERIKAIGAMAIGLIFVIIGFIVNIPME